MEFFVGISLLLGLCMNCYMWFDIRNKAKLDISLPATRTIIRTQAVFNTLNLTFHLALHIPWPFWGYLVNPSSQMWNVPFCRLLSAVGQTTSFACATNAISIVVVTREAPGRSGRERQKRVASSLICLTTFGSIILAYFYIVLLPLVMFQTWSWCPASSLLLLYGQQELKSVYSAYVVLSVILFLSLFYTRKSSIPGSFTWKILDICIVCVFLVCAIITVIILVFAGAFTTIYLFGGTLISGFFNTVNLYFNAAILALSICSPSLIFGCNSTDKVLLHSLLPVLHINKTHASAVNAEDQLQE